jgi:putative transposase
MDAYSRLIVGWSLAEHLRTELVTDALGMAIIRRQAEKQPDDERTILHSDHGCQYTSWAFGKRLRAAGLLASMGTVGDCYDNAMMESFWGTMQLEVLDTKAWQTRDELANAIFEWRECWYNPTRRHSSIGMHSPVTFETLHTGSDQDH